jgi:hypothetical protein
LHIRNTEVRNVYGILVGNFEGKESVGKPRVKREVNIKADKLHNEELRNYFSSPDIIRKIKSRTMG